jgi:hypothetical protein
MMHSKLYLVLAVLFVFVVCSISVDQQPRRSDSALDSKKKIGAYDKDDDRKKDKQKYNYDDDDYDDRVEDNTYSALTANGKNRYSTFNQPEGNYRARSRWPSSSSAGAGASLLPLSPSSNDDFAHGNDWSRYEYTNGFPSSLPSISPVPSPSISFDSNAMLGGGPSCNSLVDQQYPIFSDICGAVPQARYSLPNSFGHRERWQIAHILSSLASSSTDAACTRSLRLLLCPVLFPPCPTRYEPPPVLPCQSYCRAVKARCAIPALDLLPCEILPHSSDLCPTNQAYGSFIPPGAFPPMGQPLQMTGAHPSSNYPTARSFPSLQSILSSQGLQSASSPSVATPMQPTPSSNLYNGGPYSTDSLTSMLADLSSRQYTNDYRQTSKYAPLTRSSTEMRPTSEQRPQAETPTSNDARFQNTPRPSGFSSVVKA